MTTAEGDENESLRVKLRLSGSERSAVGTGNGPIASFIDALSSLGIDLRVLDYHEDAVGSGADAKAACFIEATLGDRVMWGAGIHPSIVTASLRAVTSAVNRAAAQGLVDVEAATTLASS